MNKFLFFWLFISTFFVPNSVIKSSYGNSTVDTVNSRHDSQSNKIIFSLYERKKELERTLDKHRGKNYFHKSSKIKRILDELEITSDELNNYSINIERVKILEEKLKRKNEIESKLKNDIGDSGKRNEIESELKQIEAYIANSNQIEVEISTLGYQKENRLKIDEKFRSSISLINSQEAQDDLFSAIKLNYKCAETPQNYNFTPVSNFAYQSRFNKCKKSPNSKVNLEMGINLTAPQAESPEIHNAVAFANIFKVARPFESLSDDLVDKQNGWPCFKNTEQVARTNLLESAEAGSVPNGIYPVHIAGDVDVDIKGGEFVECENSKSIPANYLRKCIKINIEDKLSVNGLQIYVKGKRPNACLEDLKIILPDTNNGHSYEDEILAGNISLNKDYIKYLEPFKVIRMMNLTYSSPRLPQKCIDIISNDIEQDKIWRERNPNYSGPRPSWNEFYSNKAMSCINQETRNLNNRAKLDDATYGVSYNTPKEKWRGVPIEVAVEIAKQTGSDPWITVPVNASNEYIKEMAKQFGRLHKKFPNMKFHIEYSNEVWNGRFWGAKYVAANSSNNNNEMGLKDAQEKLAQIQREWEKEKKLYVSQIEQERNNRTRVKTLQDKLNEITKRYLKKMKPYRDFIEGKHRAEVDFYIEKSLNVFDIFSHEINEDSLIRTLGTSQKDPNRTKRMLSSLKEKNQLDKVDTIATATYFHGCWGKSKLEGKECREYLHRPGKKGIVDISTPKELIEILNDPDNPEGVDSVIKQVEAQMDVLKHPDFSDHNIELVAYEGGQHLSMTNLPADLANGNNKLSPSEKKRIIDLFIDTNKDNDMEKLYEKLYQGWRNAGGKTHVNFIMAQSPSQYGSFGLSSNLNQSSAKYDTAKKYSQVYCSN